MNKSANYLAEDCYYGEKTKTFTNFQVGSQRDAAVVRLRGGQVPRGGRVGEVRGGRQQHVRHRLHPRYGCANHHSHIHQ